MPAHIFFRVGRYADASDVTARAHRGGRALYRRAPPQGIYPLYYLHNLRFLSASASMEGRSAVALAAARKVAPRCSVSSWEMKSSCRIFGGSALCLDAVWTMGRHTP